MLRFDDECGSQLTALARVGHLFWLAMEVAHTFPYCYLSGILGFVFHLPRNMPLMINLIAMGIGLLIQVSRPTLSIWSSLNFSLPFFTLSLSHNIIITLLIALRLLIQRKHIADVLGYKHAQQYISIVAIVVESAAIFSITSITFLGLYLSNNSVQNVYFQILPQVEVSDLFPCPILFAETYFLQFLGPLLLIYRVAEGRAWSSETTAALSRSEATPRFAPNHTSINTHSDVMFDDLEGQTSSYEFPGYPIHVATNADREKIDRSQAASSICVAQKV